MIAQLGNASPLHEVDPEYTGEIVTTIVFPEGMTVAEALRDVVHQDGAWNAHSDQPPTFVAASDPGLETALAAVFSCPTRVVPGLNAPEES